MPARVAVDAGKPVVRIATAQEALDRALLHRALKPARLAKLLAVVLRATPKSACARAARAVDPAARPPPRASRTGLRRAGELIILSVNVRYGERRPAAQGPDCVKTPTHRVFMGTKMSPRATIVDSRAF